MSFVQVPGKNITTLMKKVITLLGRTYEYIIDKQWERDSRATFFLGQKSLDIFFFLQNSEGVFFASRIKLLREAHSQDL